MPGKNVSVGSAGALVVEWGHGRVVGEADSRAPLSSAAAIAHTHMMVVMEQVAPTLPLLAAGYSSA